MDNLSRFRYFVGIDEVGRGPLAGPACVGAVIAERRDLALPFFDEVKDSKKLSAQKRRLIVSHMKKAMKDEVLFYKTAFVGPEVIDAIGINQAIYLGITRVLKYLQVSHEESLVLLDGGLHAPERFKHQETIIRGDEKESLIALASIAAKVRRDRRMEDLDKRFPGYAFSTHKGYGTEVHRKLIKKHEPCPAHRKSFLGNLL